MPLPNLSPPDREVLYRQQYGELLNATDVAQILRYPSAAAVLKARERGTLPVQMTKLPGRKGWYTTARSLAAFLDQVEREVANDLATEETERRCRMK